MMWYTSPSRYSHHTWFLACISFFLEFCGAHREADKEYLVLNKNLGIFANVLKELHTHYVDEVQPDHIVRIGIRAMLQSLDPYTYCMYENIEDDLAPFIHGTYGGIGAMLEYKGQEHTITAILRDYPAHLAGLQVGDVIVAINHENVQEKSLPYVTHLLKGTPGTAVHLHVTNRQNTSPREITLTLTDVSPQNVSYYGKINADTGYIQLINLLPNAERGIQQSMQALKKEGIKKLIIDLRGNPGGTVEASIQVARLFIGQQKVLITTQGRVGAMNKVYFAQQQAYDTTTPLVLLVDKNSSSGAEIVAGVIQDYDRGLLLGENTLGKGTIQVTKQLDHHTRLRLTTAKYILPSGRTVQRKSNTSSPKNFRTMGGRVVTEGAGITPDRMCKQRIIIQTLTKEDYFFTYAALFHTKHAHIPPPKDFELSNEQLEEFFLWLENKPCRYAIESNIAQLEEQVKQLYSEAMQQQVTLLKDLLVQQKRKDWNTHRKAIQQSLQQAILAYYYFPEEIKAAMLDHDQDVQDASRLLQNLKQYHILLRGPQKKKR